MTRERALRTLAWLAVTALFFPGCRGCDQNAVIVVEEVRKLAAIVDSVEILQDDDGDGLFVDEERTFVVNPSGTVGKVLRVRFLDGISVPKGRLGAPGFITFVGPFPGLPIDVVISVEAISFEDDPLDPSKAVSVVYDINDDLFNPDRTVSAPVEVTLHLSLLNDLFDPDLQDARFFFVVSPMGPLAETPPRVTRISPSLSDLPGWTRPLRASDRLPGEGLAELLGRIEAINTFAATTTPLENRPAPHARVEIEFSTPMNNLIVSVTPEDDAGLRLRSETPLPFLEPFDLVRSETRAGLAPDTIYMISALSKYTFVNVPAVSGSQEENGLFLIPNFDDDLYDELRADGFSNQDLYLDTTFVLRTGPLRITVPGHLTESNLGSITLDPGGPTGAIMDLVVQFAEPAEGSPPIDILDATVRFGGSTVVSPANWNPEPDTIQQGEVVRASGVTKTILIMPVPGGDFDGIVEITIAARGERSEFIGTDSIRFHLDVIAPEIDASSITVTNEYQDGEIDLLCVTADCDVETFVLEVDGGLPVLLDATDGIAASCVDGQREYCFTHASLGLPPGSSEGEVDVRLIAIDDQGNESRPVSFTTEPRCQPVEKFVGAGGKLLRVVTLSDGTPAVAWMDHHADLLYATWDGERWDLGTNQAAYSLPPGAADTTFGLGLGFDLIVDSVDGLPTMCLVEGAYAPGDTDSTATGTLRILKRDPTSALWNQVASRGDVRPIGCSLANYRGALVVAYNQRADHGSPLEIRNTSARWSLMAGSGLGGGGEIVASLAWDFSIVADEADRLFFAYRTLPVGPFGIQDPDNHSSPGRIVVGYFLPVHPSGELFRFSQEIADPDPSMRTSPGSGSTYCDDCSPGSCDNDFSCEPGEGPGCDDCCNSDRMCGIGEHAACPDCTFGGCRIDDECTVGEFELCADCHDGPCDFDGMCESSEAPTGCPDCCSGDSICEAGETSACPDCLIAICDDDGVCEPGESGRRTVLDEPAGVTLGAGPSIAVTPTTFELVYVSARSSFGRPSGPVTYLRSSMPSLVAPDPFEFEVVTRDDHALALQEADAISRQPGGGPKVVQVFYGRPAVAYSAEQATVYVAYPTSTRDVSLIRSPLDGSPASIDLVEARVGIGPPVGEQIIPVAIAADGDGYSLAFRNSLSTSEEIVFAREPENSLFGTGENRCSNLWRSFQVTEESLALTWRHTDVLFEEACFPGLGQVERPFAGPISSETVGSEDTLLQDLLIGVILRDGRGLLKLQDRVCLPNSQIVPGVGDACDTAGDLGTSALPGWQQASPAPSTSAAIDLSAPLSITNFPDEPTTAQCPRPRQIVALGVDGWACVQCPETTFFVPASNQCGSCSGGAVKYASSLPGIFPRTLSTTEAVSCRTCPAQDPEDIALRGLMPWLLSPDGLRCHRCLDGSQPLRCGRDEDCDFLRTEPGLMRCVQPVDWEGRPDGFRHGVCAEKCTASCDFFGGGECNGDTGACEHVVPSGLACRPIGCDTCWRNMFCANDDECPLGHNCETSIAVMSPLCVARPLLDTAVRLLPQDDPTTPDVDEGEQRDDVVALNHAIQDALADFRLPDTLPADTPLWVPDDIQDLELHVTDVELEIVDAIDSLRQGRVILHLEGEEADLVLDGDCPPFPGLSDPAIGLEDPVTVDLVFQPFVERGDDHHDEITIPRFALVDLHVGATVDELPCFPDVVGIDVGDFVASGLLRRANPTASTVMGLLLQLVSTTTVDQDGTRHNGITRCMFVTDEELDFTNVPAVCENGLPESTHWVHAREEGGDGGLAFTVRRCR